MKMLNGEYIKKVVDEVQEFNQKFSEAAKLEHEKFTKKAEENDIDELADDQEYQLILLVEWSEPETLSTLLENFKEFTEKAISEIETEINSKITQDWRATEQRVVTSQHTRNRDIIQEIVENTKKF